MKLLLKHLDDYGRFTASGTESIRELTLYSDSIDTFDFLDIMRIASNLTMLSSLYLRSTEWSESSP